MGPKPHPTSPDEQVSLPSTWRLSKHAPSDRAEPAHQTDQILLAWQRGPYRGTPPRATVSVVEARRLQAAGGQQARLVLPAEDGPLHGHQGSPFVQERTVEPGDMSQPSSTPAHTGPAARDGYLPLSVADQRPPVGAGIGQGRACALTRPGRGCSDLRRAHPRYAG